MSREFIIGGTKGRAPVADYNEVNLLETDDAKQAKLEYWICKQIGEKLVEVYPKREWGVMVNEGMVVITCPSLSKVNGYHLDMRRDNIAELQARAVIAAGEILERFGLSRDRKFNPDIVEALPRNLRDDVVVTPDTAGEDPLKKVH